MSKRTEEQMHHTAGAPLGGPPGTTHAERLRAAGQRVTPQRLLILGVFAPGEHLTADEVFARVEPLTPIVNRSTVYRTLEFLRDLGLLSETDLGSGARHFELLDDGRHHHLVCRECGHVAVFDDAVVAPLRAAIRDRYDFEARIDHLALFGRCRACREMASGGVAGGAGVAAPGKTRTGPHCERTAEGH